MQEIPPPTFTRICRYLRSKSDRLDRAFTLIELAIVIVVIGLGIGGIFVGQDMIHTSNLNKTISNKEKYIAAIMTFKTKYGCAPGDCPNASTLFPAENNVVDGNGNGLIESGNTDSGEHFQLWLHLQLAGLIEGKYLGSAWTPSGYHGTLDYYPGVNSPKSQLRDTVGYSIRWVGYNPPYTSWVEVPGGDYGTIFAIGAAGYALYANGGLSAKEAKFIDIKYDDGIPITGKIIGINMNGCIASGAYDTNASGLPCAQIIKTGFSNF